MMNHTKNFYIPEYSNGNSSFALPFVAKEKDVFEKLKEIFAANQIEYRPVVSGNLMRQPFLSSYHMASDQKSYNVEKLEYGLYIGNNHFLTDENFDLLAKILKIVVK